MASPTTTHTAAAHGHTNSQPKPESPRSPLPSAAQTGQKAAVPPTPPLTNEQAKQNSELPISPAPTNQDDDELDPNKKKLRKVWITIPNNDDSNVLVTPTGANNAAQPQQPQPAPTKLSTSAGAKAVAAATAAPQMPRPQHHHHHQQQPLDPPASWPKQAEQAAKQKATKDAASRNTAPNATSSADNKSKAKQEQNMHKATKDAASGASSSDNKSKASVARGQGARQSQSFNPTK